MMTLDHGEYVVHSDGTGMSATNWRLVKPQSATVCPTSTWGADNLWLPNGSYWGVHDGGNGGIYQYGSCVTAAEAE